MKESIFINNESGQDIDILIPFRGSSKIRIENLIYNVNHWKKYLPYSNIIIIEQQIHTNVSAIENIIYKYINVDFDEDLFCRSFLFNIGYNNSISKYLFLADADCFFEKEFIENIKLLYPLIDEKYVIPYNNSNYLTTNQSNNIRKNFFEKDIIVEKIDIDEIKKDKEFYCWNVVGGINMVSSKNFYKINGFDSSFVGWGGEDEDIYNRFLNSDIGVTRITNNMFHLRHEWNFEKSNYSKEEMEQKKQKIPKIQLIEK